MTPPVTLRPFASLRLRLTLWYALTLFGTFVLLGGGLFVVIRRQLSEQLSESLVSATDALIRAAQIREDEGARAQDPVVDAVDELHVPGRQLFLLDGSGAPVKPEFAAEWMTQAAREAARLGSMTLEHEFGERTLRLYARRFHLANGRQMVAAAVADDIELEERYASLIAAFGGAALVAVILVAIGGSFLVLQATGPVERSVVFIRQFMANAAHELRTPLSIIRSRAEVTLQHDRTDADYAGALASIEREAERMAGIVDNLLLLARADSGELPVRRERFLLDDLALDAAGTAATLAQRRKVSLVVADFDETPISGDPALVRQLLLILLDNAIKFTPPGGTVSVGLSRAEGGAIMEVRDTGAGIAPEHLPHVYERLFRADAGTRHAGGAGLGLSIAEWIVKAHGGAITMDSSLGKGTTVSVWFPGEPTQR